MLNAKIYFKRSVAVVMFFVILVTSSLLPAKQAKAEVITLTIVGIVLPAIALALGYEIATRGMGEKVTNAILSTSAGQSAWTSLSNKVTLGKAGVAIIPYLAKAEITVLAGVISDFFGQEENATIPVNTTYSVNFEDDGLSDVSCYSSSLIKTNINSLSSYVYKSSDNLYNYTGTELKSINISYMTYTQEWHSLVVVLKNSAIVAGWSIQPVCWGKSSGDLTYRFYNTLTGKYAYHYNYADYATAINSNSRSYADKLTIVSPSYNENLLNIRASYISLNGLRIYNSSPNIIYTTDVPVTYNPAVSGSLDTYLDGLATGQDVIVRPVSGVTDYLAPDVVIDTGDVTGVIGVAVPSDYAGTGDTDTPVVVVPDIPTTGTTDLTGVLSGISAVNSNVGTLTTAVTALPTATIGTGAIDWSGFMGIGLTDVFPFCIPFDMVNCVKQLVADPVAPCFTVDFAGTAMASAGTVTLDFERFEGLAKIVRYFVFLGFVLGLVMLTRSIIRG